MRVDSVSICIGTVAVSLKPRSKWPAADRCEAPSHRADRRSHGRKTFFLSPDIRVSHSGGPYPLRGPP